jgi:molybdenum cofactor guanylyltransferase
VAARPAPQREHITGLVLAGGRGSRMGGVDKGLLPWGGSTLVGHAAARLAPQVAQLAINANRELPRHRALGWPVWPDEPAADSMATTPATHDAAVPAPFSGPLAGWLAGLRAMPTAWLLSVPCDTPSFPLDLVQRLSRALAQPGAPAMALAATADGPQPVFALLHRSLAEPLALALAQGERSAWRFARAQDAAIVLFADSSAFADADTPDELARLKELARLEAGG